MADPDRAYVEQTLREVFGGVEVNELRRLTGGASRQTWTADVGGRRMIVQRQSAGAERDMGVEAAVLRAAERAGVHAPRVVECVEAPDGVITLITAFVDGETIARRILRDEEFAVARGRLIGQIGCAIAQTHDIAVDDVPGLERVDGLQLSRAHLDELGEPHPAFELAFRWLEQHRHHIPERAPCVVHGDFRLGNLIVDRDGLAAVIDWELAHLGHPLLDLGWVCVPAWRFGSPLPAAGLGTRGALLDAYNAEAGTTYTIDDLHWWEVYGILRWGVMCVTQAARHLSGTTRSHELAAIGRRVCENEHDLLLALEGRW